MTLHAYRVPASPLQKLAPFAKVAGAVAVSLGCYRTRGNKHHNAELLQELV